VLEEARRASTSLDEGLAVEGLIHLREGALLYVLAQRAAPIGDILEIGAHKGRSTWFLAQALKTAQARRKVISIDPQPRADVREAFLGWFAGRVSTVGSNLGSSSHTTWRWRFPTSAASV